MGRFCLFAYTGLTDRFRHARGLFYKLASLLKLIRSEKNNVFILQNFLYDEEQKQFKLKYENYKWVEFCQFLQCQGINREKNSH